MVGLCWRGDAVGYIPNIWKGFLIVYYLVLCFLFSLRIMNSYFIRLDYGVVDVDVEGKRL